ncbi:hypothetical protein SShM2_219 [Synechococcus phage S-ShM2]|uniref:Uncharacterized protein n=3 Tax=Ahtivirus sagseatwo TaxID=2734079 RepID=A0A1D7SJG3_9CAUD|nr:hypothetical protein SShM2_219 [Synechococcus phage S-ShM2]AGH57351.1 hypothetical protein CPLG_00097 [Cyanophage S-SSM2]AOO13318.1 hypothetical protein LIS021110_205 [Cyanophage S-RIM14]ADO97829.1 hypothetical protein SShM2_219 [Synechococcus phage S-ShM2]AOO13534.1 hypothetical protein LIS110610_205 [Cyanophage S-RIM14]AOO13750.1 hypothetical protein Np111211_205 [Cyanophage S-RIM14]
MDIQIDKDMLPKHLREMFDDDVVLDTFYADQDAALIDALGNPIERDMNQLKVEYALKKAVQQMVPHKPKPKTKKKFHSVIDELNKL